MPWKVGKKDAKGWQIIRADTEEVVGHSTSKSKAAASVRARYANSSEYGGKGKSRGVAKRKA